MLNVWILGGIAAGAVVLLFVYVLVRNVLGYVGRHW